jgi:hypothetical protein
MGGGDYTLDMEKGEVWQKTFKDRQNNEQTRRNLQ